MADTRVENTTTKQLGGVTGKGFMPGVSGNPNGRPKGSVSIKDSIRKYLQKNPGEVDRLVQYFVKVDPSLMWQMLEGRPKQNVDMEVDKDSISELTNMFRAIAGVIPNEIPSPEGSDGVRDGAEAVQE